MKYIIDGHFDLLSDVAVRRKNGEHKVIERLYYPAFKKGNVTGVVASLFVDSQYSTCLMEVFQSLWNRLPLSTVR